MTRGIIRWSPLQDLDRFFDEDMGSWGGSNFAPALDVFQDKDHVISLARSFFRWRL